MALDTGARLSCTPLDAHCTSLSCTALETSYTPLLRCARHTDCLPRVHCPCYWLHASPALPWMLTAHLYLALPSILATRLFCTVPCTLTARLVCTALATGFVPVVHCSGYCWLAASAHPLMPSAHMSCTTLPHHDPEIMNAIQPPAHRVMCRE